MRLSLALSAARSATMIPGPWLLVMTLRRTVLPSNWRRIPAVCIPA